MPSFAAGSSDFSIGLPVVTITVFAGSLRSREEMALPMDSRIIITLIPINDT